MKFFKGIKVDTKTKEYSLNQFSFIVLLLADIFLASIIFYGLSEQIDQLTDEYEYFPHTYRDIFIESDWVEENIIGKLSTVVLDQPIYSDKKTYKQKHKVCNSFDDKIDTLKYNKELVELFKKHKRLVSKYNAYDNYQKNQLGLAKILHDSIQEITHDLRNNNNVKHVITFIFKEQNTDFVDDIKSYKRFFALKRTGFGFLFLLPIIFLLSFWNRRANLKDRHLSIIISSHFIIVALLPILFELTRLLIEILPKVIFKNIYDFLIKSKLISIWYYVVILLIVLLITAVIWILQTKVFTQRRYFRNRIQKMRCTQCGIKTSYESQYCPNCANALLTKCVNCQELTIKDYEFCQKCGKKI